MLELYLVARVLTFLPEAAVLVQSLGFQILPISMEDEKKQEELKTMNNQLVFGGKKDPTHLGRSPGENVKLAATAVLLNARLRSHDMSVCMHEHALRRTRSLVDAAATPKLNLTSIARSLKQEFDSVYGPAWQCVVGKSFGSYVTHSVGGFVYFSIDDSLSVLLFKTEVKVVREVN